MSLHSRPKDFFVSVIIPTYNDQEGVDACIGALAKQSWGLQRLEVIVVDNASNPKIQLHSSSRAFAKLVVCEKPGSYAARNSGIAAARGDIFAFTDADCVPDSNWVANGVKALEAKSGSHVVGGEVIMTQSDRPSATEQYQCIIGFMQEANIKARGFTVTANLFATRVHFEKVGNFNEQLLSTGDGEWCWRAKRAGYSVWFAPEAIVFTRPRASLISAIRQARRMEGGLWSIRRLGLDQPPRLRSDQTDHRAASYTAQLILKNPNLSNFDKLGVFCVAAIIKFAKIAEQLRLFFGADPERR